MDENILPEEIEKKINKTTIKTIGGIHLAFAIFLCTYGLIFPKNKFDFFYIFFVIAMLLSWTFLNSECLVSYSINKFLEKDYQCGKNTKSMVDIFEFIGSKKVAIIILIIIHIFYLFSEFIVLKRNDYPIYIYYLLPLFHLAYVLLVGTSTGLYKNETFLFLQECLKFGFVILFVAVVRGYVMNLEKKTQ